MNFLESACLILDPSSMNVKMAWFSMKLCIEISHGSAEQRPLSLSTSLSGGAVCLAGVLERVALPLGLAGAVRRQRRLARVRPGVDRLQHLHRHVPRHGAVVKGNHD